MLKTDKDDIEKDSDDVTESASIGDMTEVMLLSQDELAAKKIIYPGMQQRSVLNAFRDLRTRLLQKSKSKNFVLLVSALGAKGGSSFVAMNMAASFALDEQKTAVYIDCNYEHSFSNQLLGGTQDFGLMDYLENPDIQPQDIIYASGISRVRVIPPGKDSELSVERLSANRMNELITDLRQRYEDRFIVIDVPPVADSSIARMLSHVVDMAVLVVPFGRVTSNQVMAGVDAVGEEKFAGIVFNN